MDTLSIGASYEYVSSIFRTHVFTQRSSSSKPNTSGDGGGGEGEGGGGGSEGDALGQQVLDAPPVVMVKGGAPVAHVDVPCDTPSAQSGHGHSSPTGRHALPADTQQEKPLVQWLTHETVLSVVASHDVAHRGISSASPVVESDVQKTTAS